MTAKTSPSPRIGLIGLGLMGHGIGRNLVGSGFALTVLGNVNRKPVESLVSLGAVEGANISELVDRSDIVILCVTGSPQVESIIYGENALLSNVRPGLIVIDCSTSEPRSSDAINRDLQKAGAIFVDAPLGRTPKEAESGTLNTMVGGSPEVIERVRPVLSAFCENIIHVGDVLSAQRLKLINNFAVVGTVALIAEAIRTCDLVGVRREALHELMSKGPLKSTLLQLTMEEILKGNLAGMKFSIRNARKDIGYYTNMVGELGAAGPLPNGLSSVLESAVDQGLGDSFLPSLVTAKPQ